MTKISIKSLFFLTLIIGAGACKKGAMNIDQDSGTVTNVVEFANTGDNVSNTAASVYPRFHLDLGSLPVGDTAKFNVNVSYSGKDVAPQDITVTLAVDEAMLDQFNDENATEYEAPPATIVSFPATVVIKKGTHQTTIQVAVVNNASFDFNVNYGLPIKIASASFGKISGNFGKAVYSFAARNIYDGAYFMEATAPMSDIVAPGLTGYYPLNIQLITFTGNSVALYDPEVIGNYAHPIKNGASTSYYGSFCPVFYFDNNGNVTSVSNYYGQLSGSSARSAVLNPAGVNKLTFNPDGSVKTLEVSYIMTQSAAYTPRTYFYEKFTYTGPR